MKRRTIKPNPTAGAIYLLWGIFSFIYNFKVFKRKINTHLYQLISRAPGLACYIIQLVYDSVRKARRHDRRLAKGRLSGMHDKFFIHYIKMVSFSIPH